MIRDNILNIKKRVELSCLKIEREPADIKIIAVSKGRTVYDIEEALLCGISDIGENRVQEALVKYRYFSTKTKANTQQVNWHMIGHLQRNKVKDAVRIFDLIHSVDSLILAEEIDREAARINKIQKVLIEIKTSPEKTKFGLDPDNAAGVIREAVNFRNLSIEGLMTIAPLSDSIQNSRPYFRMVRQLRDKIKICKLPILSMGMSDDFQIAIEEGANLLRIGRAIFNS